MSKVIGIDLGTTNSCVSVIVGGDPVVIPNELGSLITPSVVRFLKDGNVVIGEHAARARIIDPQNTITGIKRFIGRRYCEVMDIIPTVPFNVILGKNNLAMIKINGIEYSPQMISAKIVKYLKTSAELYLGEKVKRAVLTVPAYFNDTQRQATLEAGELADIDVIRIIREPTAASLVYCGYNMKEVERIAVFDLGGGTFDISILEIGEGVDEVRSIAGDGFLGGDDFDNRIVDWILEEIKIKYNIDLSSDPIVTQKIRETAIKSKCELSQLSEVTINIPFFLKKYTQSINFNLALTRSKFEDLCEELFEGLINPCQIAMGNDNIKPSDLDKVILVGGATRMSKVTEIIKRVFMIEPCKSIDPDKSVSIGAAIQGAIISGEEKNLLLLDVTAHTLGIEGGDGKMIRMVERNTTIPTRKQTIFSTSLDNQTSVEIHILEGEGPLAINNRTLGRFILDGIRPTPRGISQIEVQFEIDANGILDVTAKNLDTGITNNLRVRSSTGMS